ncbi:MAG TPA: YDG domain-containing protein [Verrucomicrobiae bacterium]|nr:YDG domain-containing protein [Verrucomicrobiae bacterium]
MKRKLLIQIGGLFVLLSAPLAAFSANIAVNVTSNLFPISDTAFGMHTSVYDNEHGNPALPGRLIESGVNTLRYPGGGYADVFHWSVNKLSPWQDGSYGYQGPSTDFGSFVSLIESAQCQAVITINFGSGQLWNAGHTALVAPPTNAEPKEAEAWVAYANGDASLFGTTNDIMIGTDSLGNNWRTVGFWAKLRSSTQAQYQSWATTAGVYDSTFNFLAINHPAPVGIKYWEIGNETFGSGYYGGGNGYSVNYAVPYPYTSNIRSNNPAFSPAIYGQQVKQFSLAMKAADPTIKIGAVVSTPLDDYGWDVINGQHWTPQVLSQCASNIDFLIAHWYFYNGSSDNGSSLLPAPAAKIPSMINGTGSHTGTSSGLKDWINQYRPGDPTNVEIFITEFGYSGSLRTSQNGKPIIGPVTMLFDVDSYATWMSYGVSNICFLEMSKTPFLAGDPSTLTLGETFYGLKLLHQMAQPGDMIVYSTSDTSNLRVQATRQQNGKVGLLFLNESLTTTQTVNVTIANSPLGSTGTQYVFGQSNFSSSQELPTSGPSSNSVSGLGNSFSVSILPYTMMVYTVPMLGGTIPTTVDVTSSANPSIYGDPVTLTATVKTNGVPLGNIFGETVTFYQGATELGTSTFKGNGSASVITTSGQFVAGTQFITAVYPGDAIYSGSTNSPAFSQIVDPQSVSILSGVAADNKVYDGTTAATINTTNVVLDGVLSPDAADVSLSTNGSTASFASPDVGLGISVTVTGLNLTGSAAANYTLTQPTGLTADILPLETPTTIAVTQESGTYHLTFAGQNGQDYRVLWSDDMALPLDQWNVLTNGTFGSGSVTITDNPPPETQNRFYRIVSP